MKAAVILFNLGGPENQKAVRPFLYRLFSDPFMLPLPAPLRQIAAAFFSFCRAPKARKIYSQINNASPILKNTQAQAAALEKKLSDCGDVKCFTAMRYSHPYLNEVIENINKLSPDVVILLPLYPQYSHTTTGSVLREADALFKNARTRTIFSFPTNPGFIAALSRGTMSAYREASKHGTPRVLFSAHGLPERFIANGDPYKKECELTTAALVASLAIPDLDYTLCFQSRVGPMKWTGPSTKEEILRAGRDKKPIVIVPISFVSENAETLVEIDITYRNLAAEEGVPHFAVVSCVGTSPEFISGLAELVQEALRG